MAPVIWLLLSLPAYLLTGDYLVALAIAAFPAWALHAHLESEAAMRAQLAQADREAAQ